MSVYRKLELTGTSPNSIEEAIQNAIAHSGESIRNMRWFEVIETRGAIRDGNVSEWQVTIKVGFNVEDK